MKGEFEIWQVPGQPSIHTVCWLEDLLGGKIKALEGSPHSGYFKTFPLIVWCDDAGAGRHGAEATLEWIKFLERERVGFGLIHVGDENYSHDLSCYRLSNCRVVLRSYYRPRGGYQAFFAALWGFVRGRSRYRIQPLDHHAWRRVLGALRYRWLGGPAFVWRQHFPGLAGENIRCIPAGPSDGFWVARAQSYLKASEREYLWSFAGDASKSDRAFMLHCLSRVGHGFVHTFKGFGSTQALDPEGYATLLYKSRFVPCPIGYVNVETYRLYEALESGCIPLLVPYHAGQSRNYFSEVLGPSPIPVFGGWREAAAFLSTVSDAETDRLQTEVASWYRRYTDALKDSLRVFVLNNARN